MGTTISVDERTLERFNDKKAETKTDHTPELSADGFVNMLLDTLEKVEADGYGDGTDSVDGEVPDALADQLQRIETAATEARNAATTAEERTNSIQNTLEGLGR
jgi:hypothetical protein